MSSVGMRSMSGGKAVTTFMVYVVIVDFSDSAEMALHWLINWQTLPLDPACIPR